MTTSDSSASAVVTPHAGPARHSENDRVLALDLEGTLISNAMSQFPRRGLRSFLDQCATLASRVVIFTAVRQVVFRPIAATLVREGVAPPWFGDVEYVDWTGAHKRLEFIPDCEPGSALLVDDNPGYIAPDQIDRWIQVPEFAHPYDDDDVLEEVLGEIRSRWADAGQ